MAVTTPPAMELLDERERRSGSSSIWRDTLGNLVRQRNAIVGGVVLLFFIFTAVFADVIATHPPNQVLIGVEGAKKLAPPCIHAFGCPETQPEYYFGIDGNVRDVFSRVVHGTRISLRIGFVTVGFAILIGGFIGALAGYAGGKTDNFLMRIMDVLLAFPSLLLAIAIVTVLGSGLVNAQLAIGVVAIPIYARIMRGTVISIRERDFVTASRALGESSFGLLVRRIIPNALTPMIVAGHARHRGCGPRGRRPVVPGPRHAAARRRMGIHDRHRPQHDVRRAASRAVPGTRAGPDRPGVQPARRRPARRTRSKAQPMTDETTTTLPESLGVSLDETVIEEIRPASERKRRRERGEKPLLEVKGLRTSFFTRDGIVRAVDGIDFHVDRGEIMGLVGESGCGKSVTSLSIMRLIAKPGRIEGGEILFDGQDLLKLSNDDMRKIRGDRISMIFQQPTSSLNPVWDVGRQIEEVLRIHRGMKGKLAHSRAEELLKMVGIPDPARRLKNFPHEMSGGMAQRVMIAMALACEPELLIADEPTTALDVTIQAQILDLMRNLRDETGTAIVLITHDLGVVAEMCDRVAVMYAGEIVEHTDVTSLYRRPLHPYTQGLIGSIPVVGAVKDELAVIPGNVPNLIDLPKGCRFAPRCATKIEEDVAIANEVHPLLRPVDPGHDVRCWLYHDAAGGLMPRGEHGERIGPPPARGESGFGA